MSNGFIYVAQNNLIGKGIRDIEAIVSFYKYILPPTNWVPLFCGLYPENYDFQLKALTHAISESNNNNNLLQRAKDSFLKYLKEIPSNDRALDFLLELQKKVHITPQELLNATSKHLSKNFQSVADILQPHTVADSLTEDGLRNFSEDFSDINTQEVALANLFSYYNLRGNDGLEEFISATKPEIIQKIRSEFTPSDHKVLITTKELESLSLLLVADNIVLPIVNEISVALSKITIENFPKNKIRNFRFGDSNLLQRREKITEKEIEQRLKSESNAILSEERKAEIIKELEQQKDEEYREKKSAQFRVLLNKAALKKDEIANFFKEVLMLEGDINIDQHRPLNDFFMRDKFLLAALLEKKGGIDEFQSAFFSLADGCYANIGTHARTAVVNSLVGDDVGKRVLFSVFCQDISNPILTNIGVDHPEENTTATTLFASPHVNCNYYSPNALVKKIKEEFYKDGKRIQNASEFLKKDYNYKDFENKVDSLLTIAGDYYNEYEAELATYFLIKKEIPTLLDNPYLKDFRKRSEILIKEIEQRAAAEDASVTTASPKISQNAASKLSEKKYLEATQKSNDDQHTI